MKKWGVAHFCPKCGGDVEMVVVLEVIEICSSGLLDTGT